MTLKNVVDLTTLKNLSEEHLTIHKSYNDIPANSYLYGSEFPYGDFRGFQIVELSDIKWTGGKFTKQY